ncbi:hypothetical protein [Halapricum desulfuricans]|uniref:Putative membrane protein n=1 Tax=Halapricum desulfuricans TaxID=2841257 RepID=A0A897N7S5_9EURY|nr:hypothetical protein [Halapricum desulfuricans]QSG07233.1 putative membrane protein [Halapricum desulfuricans]
MDIRSRTRNAELARGAVAGALGFFAGYLLTWIFAGAKVTNLTIGGVFGGGVPDWRAVLWVFYDSHFVGTRTPEVFGPGGDRWAGGDLIDTVKLLGVEYLYLVPVVVLLIGGVAMARFAGARTARDGAMAGATLTLGYVPLVLLGLFVATQGGVAPSPLRALVIAGVVYPIALGAIGGAVTGFYFDSASESSRAQRT